MYDLSFVLPDSLWHPSPIAARAKFFGLTPPELDGASVLEVECGDGGNTLSMAASLPGCRFHGVTSSEKGLETGNAILEACRLENVTLEKAGIGDLEDAEGYDFILVRKIFWTTPPEERAGAVRKLRALLRRGGLLMMEQYCYPGWTIREGIRMQVRHHVRGIEDPQEKIRAGRAFLHALAQSVPVSLGQYQLMARAEHAHSTRVPDVNFGLEYLETGIHPSTFSEFAESLKGNGLQFVCDASLHSMLMNQFPQAMASVLPGGGGVEEKEQYIDFLTNRVRRVSILCDDELEVNRAVRSDSCRDLLFSFQGLPEKGEAILEEQETTITSPAGTKLVLRSQAGKAALLVLGEKFPRRLGFDEVCEEVAKKVAEFSDADRDAIADTLAICIVSDVVQIDLAEGDACLEVTEKPVASALVRAQAASGSLPYVSSLYHRAIIADPAAMSLLAILDGEKDEKDLRQELSKLVEEGKLKVQKEGQPTDDRGIVESVIEKQVSEFLLSFANNGLLAG